MKRAARFYGCLLMLLMASGMHAQLKISYSSRADTARKDIVLDKGWKFHDGDNKAWASPAYNDSAWEVLSVSKVTHLVEIPPKKFSGIGWVRLRFKPDSSLTGKPLALSLISTGAEEIFLDGKMIAAYGKVSTSEKDEKIRGVSGDAILVVFNEPGKEHVIAMRYSNFSLSGLKNGIFSKYTPISFLFSLSDWESYNRQKSGALTGILIILGFLMGFFAALCMLHLLLFLFFRQNRSNLYYSIFSCCMFFICLMFSDSLYAIYESNEPPEPNRLYVLLFPATFISLSGFLHSLFYDRVLWQFKAIIALCVLSIATHLANLGFGPYISLAATLFTGVECLRVVFRAMNRKKDGAWIIGTGVIIAIAFPLLCILIAILALSSVPDKGLTEIMNIVLSIMFGTSVLSISLSMSIFLARQFARTNRDLQAQLVQVKTLSAKTLEQEQEKKKILESQKEQLEVQVKERTAEVVKQKEEIEEKSMKLQQAWQDITDSIHYAQRIQQSILPPAGDIEKVFPSSFVLFKPKDIVSGDFYWLFQRESSWLIAAADCTGHGVPGAFMSALGSEKLNEAAALTGDVSSILQRVNRMLKRVMHQNEKDDSTRDGMDIAIVNWITKNTNEATLEYAGANRPLWVIRKGGTAVEETKATKVALGGLTEDEQVFEKHSVELKKGDTIYIFSDGYADQFSPQDKKLMTKRFKEILLGIQEKDMIAQKSYLNSFIEEWRGNAEQIDDILVIGIRV